VLLVTFTVSVAQNRTRPALRYGPEEPLSRMAHPADAPALLFTYIYKNDMPIACPAALNLEHQRLTHLIISTRWRSRVNAASFTITHADTCFFHQLLHNSLW
jgi:hypothetical protein